MLEFNLVSDPIKVSMVIIPFCENAKVSSEYFHSAEYTFWSDEDTIRITEPQYTKILKSCA